MNRRRTFVGLSLLTPNMHKDGLAEKQICGTGIRCNGTGVGSGFGGGLQAYW